MMKVFGIEECDEISWNEWIFSQPGGSHLQSSYHAKIIERSFFEKAWFVSDENIKLLFFIGAGNIFPTRRLVHKIIERIGGKVLHWEMGPVSSLG